jgi:hypothetical protein
MKRLGFITAGTAFCLMLAGVLTLSGQGGAGPVNAKGGVAIHGYDVVAYFTEGRAVKGRRDLTVTHDGVTWQFASTASRDRFAAEPGRYQPQFGGYCAYGVTRGYAVDIDPEAFAIVDGRLYLNYSKRVQRTWDQDRPGHIRKGEAEWPKVRAGLLK